MAPPPRRSFAGFRLNAPQAESQASNGSGEFAGLGDELDPAGHGPFATDDDDDQDHNYDHNYDHNRNNVREETPVVGSQQQQQRQLPLPLPQQQQPQQQHSPKSPGRRPSLTLEQHRQLLLQQQVEIQLRQQQQLQFQQQQQQQYEQAYPQQQHQQPPPLPYRTLIIIGICIIVLLIGLIVTVLVVLGGEDTARTLPAATNNGSTNSPTTDPRPTPSVTVAPTALAENGPTLSSKTVLGRIVQRGTLRCGVGDSQPGFSEINVESGDRVGIDVELCRAVSAAIFGDDQGHVEFVPVSAFDRFQDLAAGDYDLMNWGTTHTMERQVVESTTGQSFDFTVPYLYTGLQFAGIPEYVACTDTNSTTTLNETNVCATDLKICALDGTTHIDIITTKFPNVLIVSVVGSNALYSNFLSGLCNVMASEQFDIVESILRDRGYIGDYELGAQIHSKEPLCMVTTTEDPAWSDFVNWVLQALFAAEDAGIVQETADLIGETTVFGEGSQLALAFRNAVKAVGSYSELYQRALGTLLERPTINTINTGETGLLYSFPFGDLDIVGPTPPSWSTLSRIKARGFLKCGISTRVIFANFNETTQAWDGFDVDFCKALSAAIFEGETDTVEYMDLSASDRFIALNEEDVDVLSRLTTVTLERDILEPTTGVGFTFSQPNFYDGLTFGGIPQYAVCADTLDVTSSSCSDLLICVIEGTTFESIVNALFPERFVVPRASIELSVQGLISGECNVIAGGVVDVSLTTIRSAGYDGEYQTGSNRYSRDPLALVTRHDDTVWSNFVFWIVASTFYAEEEGITKDTADAMPEVSLFGPLYTDMFRLAIGAVGNYGEIYARQAEAEVPRGGLNELNGSGGPQMYPLPGINM